MCRHSLLHNQRCPSPNCFFYSFVTAVASSQRCLFAAAACTTESLASLASTVCTLHLGRPPLSPELILLFEPSVKPVTSLLTQGGAPQGPSERGDRLPTRRPAAAAARLSMATKLRALRAIGRDPPPPSIPTASIKPQPLGEPRQPPPPQTHSGAPPGGCSSMLAASLRALQRAAALQATPASAAASEIATLPGLAAALQRLTVQQPSWAAGQAGGQRHFAAAAADGSSGGEGSSSSEQQAVQEAQGAGQLRSESGQLAFADAEEALEAWGTAMDQGAPPGAC